MAATEASRPLITYAEYMALPEGAYNLIEGELLVTPAASPRHQKLQARLLAALLGWSEATGCGDVYGAPLDVTLRKAAPPIVVQPDLLFLAPDSQARLTKTGITGAPDLAIEILSPGSRHLDGVRKRTLYESFGTREYWLVCPESEQIEVLALEAPARFGPARMLAAPDELASHMLPGFALALSKLFRP